MTHRPTLIVVLLFLAASAAPAEVDGSAPSWNAQMSVAPETPGATGSALRLVRASYAVDVLGSLAVGELVQVFVNESAADVSASYAGHPPGLSIRGVEVEVAGETQELAVAAKTPPRGRAAASARAGRTGNKRDARPQPSRKIDVEAGQSATVRTTFRLALPIRDGRFLLRLPAVTGKAPQEPSDEAAQVSPGPPGTIRVSIHHEEPLPFAESSSHELITAYEGDRTVIEPVDGEAPSREFELEFALGVEDDATLLGSVTSSDNDVHQVIAVLAPPMTPPDESVRPKQVLFVLDTSGSMAKGKLDQARAALGACLEKLSAVDQFNIVGFNAKFRMLDEMPVSAEGNAPQSAMGWMAGLRHGGGTVLLPALRAMLDQPESDEYHRMIVLLTDGALQDRNEVLELLQTDLGEGRMFVIGIGDDVSRQTIEHMADLGRGMAVFAEDTGALDAVLGAMFDSVSEPLAWDLAVNWGGAEVQSMEPARLPDLYAGRPVTIRATVRGELPEQLQVEATTTSGLRQFTTDLSRAGEGSLSGLDGR
jgi:Ca-activated chloride channel family protein